MSNCNNVVASSVNDIYKYILQDLFNNAQPITVRGNACHELTPYCFTLTDPRRRLLDYPGIRNIKKYIFGELIWYLTGRNDVAFIDNYAKMWKSISDDGITSNSAYGQYIFKPIYEPHLHSHISQWDWVKHKLTEDPNTREAIIHIKPIQCYDTKDYVCTLTLSFNIRNGKLNMIVNMRSSDIWTGLVYDIFMFTFMQELMAVELQLELGTYTHFTNNVHYYDKDLSKLKDMYYNLCIYDNDTALYPLPKLMPDFRTHDVKILENLDAIYHERDKHGSEVAEHFVDTLSESGNILYKKYLLGEN